MTIVYLIILSCISAMLYRMGGCGPADLQAEWGWVPSPIRNFPKKRDVGCGVTCLVGCGIVGITGPWWAWLLAFGCMWGALSTYHDYVGHDNFFLHGLVIGLALALPLGYWNGWGPLLIRSVVLALAMGVWSYLVDVYGTHTTGFRSDRWSELGRGALIPLTLGLVCLF